MKRFILHFSLCLIASLPLFAQEQEEYIDPAGSAEEYPASLISKTLPVIYINTKEGAPIVDKVTNISAGLYVDPMGVVDAEALGTADEPIELTIRGRGNSSFQHVKKPYKLKFAKKTSILGFAKSKHFVLLPHYCCGNEWAACYAGYEIGHTLGMGWQPGSRPVELVLNGRYDGVYFLTEPIKIDSNRLDIFEQEDGETDPEIIPYGWLIEIDNYEDEFQHSFDEKEGQIIRFTFKAPEELSEEQAEWITRELEELNALIYNSPLDDPKWSEKIDVTSLARYFIVRELFHDTDGYSGSFYMHRDKQEDAKWTFGPLWDITIGSSQKDSYLSLDPELSDMSIMHWIPKVMEYPVFQEAYRTEWTNFYSSGKIDAVIESFNDFSKDLGPAFETNNARWTPIDIWTLSIEDRNFIANVLRNNAAWMNEHLDLATEIEKGVEMPEATASEAQYFTIQGLPVAHYPTEPGIYIMKVAGKTSKIIIR